MPIRVVCSSCEATYNVPEERITSAVVKATCKVCGSEIIIQHNAPGTSPGGAVPSGEPEESTGNWTSAIVDNTETERLLDTVTGPEGTLPPEIGKRQRDRGDEVITSLDDLQQVFPEDDPVPPPTIRGAHPGSAVGPGTPRPRPGRRKRSGAIRAVVIVLAVVTVAAALLYAGDQLGLGFWDPITQ